MKPPENTQYLLFGGTFVLANKLQCVGDRLVAGLSTKQWFLLRNIVDLPGDPPPTITQIAHAMDSTRQNVAKMLEAMAREGLVTLAPSETDRRSRSVCITASGLTYVKEAARNAQGFLDRLYAGISSAQRDAAGAVMKKMMLNLQQMEDEFTL